MCTFILSPGPIKIEGLLKKNFICDLGGYFYEKNIRYSLRKIIWANFNKLFWTIDSNIFSKFYCMSGSLNQFTIIFISLEVKRSWKVFFLLIIQSEGISILVCNLDLQSMYKKPKDRYACSYHQTFFLHSNSKSTHKILGFWCKNKEEKLKSAEKAKHSHWNWNLGTQAYHSKSLHCSFFSYPYE